MILFILATLIAVSVFRATGASHYLKLKINKKSYKKYYGGKVNSK